MAFTKSKQQKDSASTSEALIERARRLLILTFPTSDFPSLNFESARWDLRPLSTPRGAKPSTLYFTALDDPKKPLPKDFANMIKAVIVFGNYQRFSGVAFSDACRFLWAALSRRLAGNAFIWDGVTTCDFEAAEHIMEERGLSPTTMSTYLHYLNVLKNWLNENGVCDGIEWSPKTPHPNHSSIRTKADKQKRIKRLPTKRAIQGLAEIYHHAKEPRDRLLICAVGLLLVGGFRISELLTLPFDCWVSDYHRGRERFGLKYWNRKAKGGAWQWAIRWLSPMGAKLARLFLDEINAITATVRDRARILERDPLRVEIPIAEDREKLTTQEIAFIFKTTAQQIRQRIYEGRLNLTPVSTKKINHLAYVNFYLKSDVEAELLKMRGKLYTLDLGNGKFQSLSETLLIAHPGFLRQHEISVVPLFVTHLTRHEIQYFLAGTKRDSEGYKHLSAFERFGIREPVDLEDGEARSSKMRSSMFRHWLNTLAHKSGMSVSQITMWMQRTDPSHTLVYLHSSSDMADLAREGVKEGRYAGYYADEVNSLSLEDRDDYLKVIQTAHKTNTGICTANFGVDNCELNKTCELGCRFYLRDPGNENDSKNLLAKRQSLKLAIENIKEAERGGRRIVSRQLDMNEQWVAEIDRLLALKPAQ
jgi:hypothetical protein